MAKSTTTPAGEGKRNNGKRNKSAGHQWERDVINLLHERGLYEKGAVVTTRSNSRRLDASGIDLMHLDEATYGHMQDSIQCKTAGSTVPYPKLLDAIRKSGRKGAVVLHRQTSPSASGKHMERDRFAITYMDRYLELLACEKMVAIIKDMIDSKISLEERNSMSNEGYISYTLIEDELKKLSL